MKAAGESSQPGRLQRHVQQQPVLALVEVEAGELLHPGEPVVERLPVDAERRGRAAGLARAVEEHLGGTGEFGVGGSQQARTAGSCAASGGSAVSRRYGPIAAHSATGPSRGSARAARAAAESPPARRC